MGTSDKLDPGGATTLRREGRIQNFENSASRASGGNWSRYPFPKQDVADQIGACLRSVYDDVLAQPVPDRFLELLRQLETAPGASFAPAKKDGP